MDIHTFKNIIDRFLQGNICEDEEKTLQNFENQMIEKNSDTVFSSEMHEKRLQKEIYGNILTSVKRPTPIWQRMAVAASFLLLISCGLFYFFLKNNSEEITENQFVREIIIRTNKNEERNILLEDGTKITLYQESTLSYPEPFSEDIRKVSLSGEAFFEVAKNEQKPFIVQSGNIETQVLGTSFNIEAYQNQDNIKVTLASGKVKVCSENQQITLTPSQQAVFNKSLKTITSQNIDLEDFMDMKNGILRLNKASISQVAKKLEEFYNIKISISVPKENQCVITGIFNKESLDVVLKQIAFVHQGIIFEKIADKHIIIKGKCN